MKDLPNEIVNKILMYREIHPIINILKPIINQYNEYNEEFDNDDNTPFSYYVVNVRGDVYYENLFDIKIRRKNKEGCLRCWHCGKWLELYDKYLMNTNVKSVFCLKCLSY